MVMSPMTNEHFSHCFKKIEKKKTFVTSFETNLKFGLQFPIIKFFTSFVTVYFFKKISKKKPSKLDTFTKLCSSASEFNYIHPNL